MAVDDRLNIYGVSIFNGTHVRMQGVSIFNGTHVRLHGINIVADNYFSGKILVSDSSQNAIANATVTMTTTQTNPKDAPTSITGTTDANGEMIITGSSTVGTSIKIEKSGFHTYEGPIIGAQQSTGIFSNAQTFVLNPMKKVYVTNRGNIVINPNDSTLFELS